MNDQRRPISQDRSGRVPGAVECTNINGLFVRRSASVSGSTNYSTSKYKTESALWLDSGHTHAQSHTRIRKPTTAGPLHTDETEPHRQSSATRLHLQLVCSTLARSRSSRTRALAVPVACGCLCWSVRRQWSGMAGGLEEPETGSENGQQSVSLTQLACHRASHTTGHYIHVRLRPTTYPVNGHCP